MAASAHGEPNRHCDQAPLVNKFLSHDDITPVDLAVSTDKVDCERGLFDQTFLLKESSQPLANANYRKFKLLGIAAFFGLVLLLQRLMPFPDPFLRRQEVEHVVGLDDVCPQVDALPPPGYEVLLASLDDEFGSDRFKLKAYESLGGAIRIPTVSYDDLGLPSKDPRWEIFAKFHDYLEARFPKVHATLERTKVNTYGLVYEWKGTESVKPLMLTGHMDVVPVDQATQSEWINPPYSGHYDGEWIWGRGSCDDKAGVIGILTAIETLLEQGFKPSRTVLLAFGSDEESGGSMAREIGKYLLETRGPDSLAMLVDEGDGWTNLNGTLFASPSVAEKGYLDIRMDVTTPGGHSSKPPKHTGIGILANVITELEDHPFNAKVIRGRTYYQNLECRARYDPGFPISLSKLVEQSRNSDAKLRELEARLAEFDPDFYPMTGTTQAIDLVGGGVKVNALPEAAWAVANYRIADYSSRAEVIARVAKTTRSVAAKHNMTLIVFGKTAGPERPSRGTIHLSDAYNTSLEPAPVTPTIGSGPYEVLSRAIRSTLQTHLRTDGLPRTAVVSPGLSTGNTDTVHYWNLTKHIFRYNHQGVSDSFNGEHTINEANRAQGFLEQIRFTARLILNADRSDLLE